MSLRGFIIWCSFAMLAILNGVLRVEVVAPRIGEAAAHLLATVLLCTAIVAVTWLTLPWIGIASPVAARRLGLAWLLLTLAFEFLAGHFVFGHSWARLLADYNVLRGRVWVLVLLTAFAAPGWALARRHQ